jgi:hypothetical protein
LFLWADSLDARVGTPGSDRQPAPVPKPGVEHYGHSAMILFIAWKKR